jgi:hypothetical protein
VNRFLDRHRQGPLPTPQIGLLSERQRWRRPYDPRRFSDHRPGRIPLPARLDSVATPDPDTR